jgi:hypothetical protein
MHFVQNQVSDFIDSKRTYARANEVFGGFCLKVDPDELVHDEEDCHDSDQVDTTIINDYTRVFNTILSIILGDHTSKYIKSFYLLIY